MYTDIFLRNGSILIIFCVGKISVSCWSHSKKFFNPHMLSLSVYLNFFLAVTTIKIGQLPQKFDMLLNYTDQFYVLKIFILLYIDLFTEQFKNWNAIRFTVFLTDFSKEKRLYNSFDQLIYCINVSFLLRINNIYITK